MRAGAVWFVVFVSLLAWSAVLLPGAGAEAAVYYVATTGSDSDPGTEAEPFLTLQHAAGLMVAGDTCVVRAGTYRETVRPANSGTAARRITFAAYPGEEVTISGADPVTGWTLEGGSIYRASAVLPQDHSFHQVFVDGEMVNWASWPDSPLDQFGEVFASADAGSSLGVLVEADLPAVDLTGAWMYVHSPSNLPDRHGVAVFNPFITGWNHTTHTVSFDQYWCTQPMAWAEGSLYAIVGVRSLLDAPGEWHYDAATDTLRLRTPTSDSPSSHVVEAKMRQLAFDLSARSYVTVRGFNVFSATISMAEADHCLAEQCDLRYVAHWAFRGGCWGYDPNVYGGVLISGHDNELRDSTITWSSDNGVALRGTDNAVRNCLIEKVNYSGTSTANVYMAGEGNIVHGCTLRDSGRFNVFLPTVTRARIEHNEASRAGLVTRDLGAIYTWNADGQGTEISHNITHGIFGYCATGIYLDNGSRNFVVHHNLVYDAHTPDVGGAGICLNTPSYDNLVYNNTVTDCTDGVGYWGPPEEMYGTRLINNLFTDEVRTAVGAELITNYIGDSPGFVNPGADNYRLLSSSPCRDAGSLIDGVDLPYSGAAPDQGAFEYGLAPWTAGHDFSAPSAEFAASVLTGPASLTVDFLNLSVGTPTGPITAQYWDFGDGGTSTEENPSHTYTAVGSYMVSLTVENAAGSDTETKPSYIHVVFTDTGEAFWATDYILACVNAGIVGGYGSSYRPTLTVTRDAMAVFISRAMAGGDSLVPTGPPTATFTDVPTNHWAYRYVEYAVSEGVVGGYGSLYRPTVTVTRDAMAVFVARAMCGGDASVPTGPPTAFFSDVPTDHWAFRYVEYIRGEGVVGGYGDGTYRPLLAVTRDAMAVYIQRAFALPM